MVKTGLCNFSGFHIYPGHGIRYIRADSRVFNFGDKKSLSLFLLKRNPRNIRWTSVYRRLHKGKSEEVVKKKARRTGKFQRAIVGASLEVIRQKRKEKPEQRQAARDAALKELKDRKQTKRQQKTTTKKDSKVTGTTTTASKQKKQGGSKGTGKASSKR